MEVLTRYVLPGATAVCTAAAIAFATQGMAAATLFAWVAAAVFACGWAVARSTRLGILLTAIGCLSSNAYLLIHKWSASGAPSICTVNATINCDALNESAYSELFGVPVTLIGAAFYLGLAIAALAKPQSSPRLSQLVALFSLLSLAFSAYLGVAAWSLGVVCAMCISIYAGNALLLLAGLKGLREDDLAIAEDLAPALSGQSFWTISGVFLAVLLVGTAAWEGHDGAEAAILTPGHGPAHMPTPSEVVGSLYATPLGEVKLDGTEPIFGDPNAPFLLVEFADFGCPHCAHASKELPQVLAEHPELQVRFKAFPLSGACNPLIEGDEGAERCVGALAAECANRQGKFWPMSRNMFENLGYLDLKDLRFMAGQEGIDMPAWEACLQDPEAQQSVLSDVEAGITAGVQGTPTLFLKGTHGDDFVLVLYTIDEVVQILDAVKAGVVLPEPGPPPPQH